jgi:uncharacterized protein (TIGR02246 family)
MVAMLAVAAGASAQTDRAALAKQVGDRERAFAKTMADRDHAAFATFVSEEGVFFSQAGPLRGRKAVAEAWKKFYAEPKAPFSWEPREVEVLDSGTLAMTSGPVYAPDGTRIGTFTTLWRKESDGVWRVVFDKGCPPCNCKPE